MQCPRLLEDLSEELSAARSYIRSRLRAQEAGVFASSLPLLDTANTIGGAYIGMPMPQTLQESLFPLTCKQFNGPSVGLTYCEAPGLAMRATALLFSPGSAQFVGAHSQHLLRLILHVMCDILRAAGHKPHILFVSIDNRVATGRIGFRISLESMYNYVEGFFPIYDPRVFPGMICMYKRHGQQIVMIVFDSGNVAVLGITALDAANRLFLQLATLAEAHRNTQPPIGIKRKNLERETRLRMKENEARVDAEKNTRLTQTSKLVVALVKRFMDDNANLPEVEFARRFEIERGKILHEAARIVAKAEEAKQRRQAAREARGAETRAAVGRFVFISYVS